MRVLLVNPEFPDSYWSGSRSLPFVRRKSLIPPLPLLTVAALLPDHWEMRLVDLNVEELREEELDWAEVVMITGMLVQKESMHEILDLCRSRGIRTVVGGPYVTALPDEFEAADHVVVGEGENIVPELARDLEAGEARSRYHETGQPDMKQAPLPRFDLLDVEAYHHMALQYSRGCPFTCEFCDIIVMYGRTPRTKTTSQVLTELEAIRATGFRGDVFFVDDNFIGNKKHLKEMLPEIANWRRDTSAPLDFYTEASLNLADDEKLVALMTRAGFSSVFIGIESPSEAALRETKKLQNLRRDIASQVHWLLERGIDVYGGFILGFDSDDEGIFDRMIEFVHKAAIPYAMVGMLTALPNTPLYERLEAEGRLRGPHTGDQFGLTNIDFKLPLEQMVRGYKRVLETLYHPEDYFERCRRNLVKWTPRPDVHRALNPHDFMGALRSVWAQGVEGPYRTAYWKFLRWVVRHQPHKLARAVRQAAAGHHYITYTREVVVPSLAEKIAELPLPKQEKLPATAAAI